jgi:hypothetical protein
VLIRDVDERKRFEKTKLNFFHSLFLISACFFTPKKKTTTLSLVQIASLFYSDFYYAYGLFSKHFCFHLSGSQVLIVKSRWLFFRAESVRGREKKLKNNQSSDHLYINFSLPQIPC